MQIDLITHNLHQQDDLEAAKVYAEFVASFEEPKPYQLGTTSFVKSGTLLPRGMLVDTVQVACTKRLQIQPQIAIMLLRRHPNQLSSRCPLYEQEKVYHQSR